MRAKQYYIPFRMSFDDDMGGGAGGGDRDRDGDRDGDGFDLELDGLDDGSDNAQAEAVVSISSLRDEIWRRH